MEPMHFSEPRQSRTSWWTETTPDAFIARCQREAREHMAGSLGERWVGAVMVVGQETYGGHVRTPKGRKVTR